MTVGEVTAIVGAVGVLLGAGGAVLGWAVAQSRGYGRFEGEFKAQMSAMNVAIGRIEARLDTNDAGRSDQGRRLEENKSAIAVVGVKIDGVCQRVDRLERHERGDYTGPININPRGGDGE